MVDNFSPIQSSPASALHFPRVSFPAWQDFPSTELGMSAETSFPTLVLKAKSGDSSALERLMLLYGPTVRSETRSFQDSLKAEVSVQDLEQEVWVRVWTRLPGFVGSSDDESCRLMFGSWLRLTTRRVALSIIEKGRAKKRGGSIQPDRLDYPVEASDRSPSSIVRADESKEQLLGAIDALEDADTKEIVQLHFFEGLSMQDIADRMDLTRDQVRYRIQLALEMLGRRLEDPGNQTLGDD